MGGALLNSEVAEGYVENSLAKQRHFTLGLPTSSGTGASGKVPVQGEAAPVCVSLCCSPARPRRRYLGHRIMPRAPFPTEAKRPGPCSQAPERQQFHLHRPRRCHRVLSVSGCSARASYMQSRAPSFLICRSPNHSVGPQTEPRCRFSALEPWGPHPCPALSCGSCLCPSQPL